MHHFLISSDFWFLENKSILDDVIAFDIEVNSILNATSMEKCIDKINKIVIIKNKGRPGEDDIVLLIKEAEKLKEEDNNAKERIEDKNTLEQYAYQIKITLKDEKLKDKFSKDEKKETNWCKCRWNT